METSTLFELVRERGLRQVARETSTPRSTLSRCVNAQVGIRDYILDRFEKVYGSTFSRSRTVLEWDERRRLKTAQAS